MLARKFRLPSSIIFHFPFVATEKEFSMKSQKNSLHFNRFGFVAGKSVAALATERNRIKRRFRAIIEQQRFFMNEGYDVLFILKPAIKACLEEDLLVKIRTALQKAKIL